MDLEQFTDALEAHLRRSKVAFAYGDLMAFTSAVWPLVDAEAPDVAAWAVEFCNSQLRGLVEGATIPVGGGECS